MEKEEFNRMFKEGLPEMLAEWSTDEERRDFCNSSGVYTPPGLPILVPTGEDAEGSICLVRFDVLRKHPEYVLDATAYLRGIGMTTMAKRLVAHFKLTCEH